MTRLLPMMALALLAGFTTPALAVGERGATPVVQTPAVAVRPTSTARPATAARPTTARPNTVARPATTASQGTRSRAATGSTGAVRGTAANSSPAHRQAASCMRRDSRGRCVAPATRTASWQGGLPTASGGQRDCPDGTIATLARGHSDVTRCIPL